MGKAIAEDKILKRLYVSRDIFNWPVEVDSFLCELSLAVCRVFIGFVLDDLHPFPSITLLMAVFTDHVQLPNPVLEDKTQREDKYTVYQPGDILQS